MRPMRNYINPYLAGALLGVVLFLAFLITGNGLGASGALSRIAVCLPDLLAPDHVNRTPYLLEMAGGNLNPLDHWLVWMLLGAVIGGASSGWFSGRLFVETVKGPQVSSKQRWILAFVGGVIMGYGARFARGCTSGQALSGGAVLSAGSWAFMFAVFAGAYALAYLLRNTWLPKGGDHGSL